MIKIQVDCSMCNQQIVVEPDDLAGWEGNKPFYVCSKCEYKLGSPPPEESEYEA